MVWGYISDIKIEGTFIMHLATVQWLGEWLLIIVYPLPIYWLCIWSCINDYLYIEWSKQQDKYAIMHVRACLCMYIDNNTCSHCSSLTLLCKYNNWVSVTLTLRILNEKPKVILMHWWKCYMQAQTQNWTAATLVSILAEIHKTSTDDILVV